MFDALHERQPSGATRFQPSALVESSDKTTTTTGSKTMYKVTFQFDGFSTTVFQNGVAVGRICHGREVWGYVKDADGKEQFALREKYGRNKVRSAKMLLKAVLENMTSVEYLNKLNEQDDKGYKNTPLGIAKQYGYDSLTAKFGAKMAADLKKRAILSGAVRLA